MLSYSDIDDIISNLKANSNELEKCNKFAKCILKKRKQKRLQLSGQIDILKRNAKFMPELLTGCLKCKSSGNHVVFEREKKASYLREQNENEIALRKFTLTYRAEISKMLVNVSIKIRIQ